jgi:class 3 adenylate cyclase
VRLRARALELGATEAETADAAARGMLGPLALDLATRGPGETVELDDFVAHSGMDAVFVRHIWTALGLPVGGPVRMRVTARTADTVRFIDALRLLLGEDAALALARVMGSAMARLAEAVADAFRVGSEMPQLSAGTPYADVVEANIQFTRDGIPLLLEAVGALFQRHLVLVSNQYWQAEEGSTTVTRRRTIGFADLVGSTDVLVQGSVRDLARLVDGFEAQTWDLVTSAGGRVVKLIGDEAMFVFEDAVPACEVALALATTSPHPVRIGLAHGEVVGLHGDYYGGPVNLAARLVRAAEPSTVVVAESVRQAIAVTPAARDAFTFDALVLGVLKGFPGEVSAYALSPQNGPRKPTARK